MALVLSRCRARAAELESAAFEGATRRLLFSIGKLEHGASDSAAGLSEQLLPILGMSVEFLRRARALEGFAHGIKAVAHHLGAGMVAVERQVGVIAHAAIRAGLIKIRR